MAETTPVTTTVTKKKKAKRSVPAGQLHVKATFNNTIICVTDKKGEVLAASSSGACGFTGSKKGTAYAAQVASEKALVIAQQGHGLKSVDVLIKGIGLGRDAAMRPLSSLGILIESVKDVTGVPHGGVRQRRPRRG